MLKRGLKGKDMGRRGRSDENDEVYGFFRGSGVVATMELNGF